ncbi:MAG TPA: glutamate--tRNA ligase [Verrucomicrobiae bacterium]|jgi:glutamyl-tRNA synthetase|nr:glutamate--tRNA ligase [Verrucomicrobiae bacterium]
MTPPDKNSPETRAVRVRFAPSPTGYLHIGGVRTALFNYLYARNQGGKFLLRIEDTDQQRSKKEFEDEIVSSMKWLGLTWDEELVYQSKRLDRYHEIADKLIAEGKAYEKTEDGKKAVWFKIPHREVIFTDLVHGPTKFDTSLFEDLVIIKSDGFPTYHFACVIDDHDMEISHVIRGDDHISNTPRHILLYEALGWKPTKYAHLPLIVGDDNAPLSKRHGTVAAGHYRDQGFLPQALVNFLALLGWGAASNEEIFTLQELCQKFSLKKVNKANARFNLEKLLWINAQHLKNLPKADYVNAISAFYPEESRAMAPEVWEKIVLLFQTRIKTFRDLKTEASYVFEEPAAYDESQAAAYLSRPEAAAAFEAWVQKAGALPDFNDDKALEALTRDVAKENGLEAKDMIHPLRFFLTGKTVSPGLFELMNVLGKEKCLRRITRFTGKKSLAP